MEENLALDDALVQEARSQQRCVLRLWWGDGPTVVLGNSENPENVVDVATCRRLGVPILRRSTGGGAVLQASGVLNYSLIAPASSVLCVKEVFALGAGILARALARLGVQAEVRGTSDLAVGDRKISGNAQSWRRGGMLLHGTLLYDLDIELVEACLRHPPREPDYRRGRRHRDFMITMRELGVQATSFEVESAVVTAAWDLARIRDRVKSTS